MHVSWEYQTCAFPRLAYQETQKVVSTGNLMHTFPYANDCDLTTLFIINITKWAFFEPFLVGSVVGMAVISWGGTPLKVLLKAERSSNENLLWMSLIWVLSKLHLDCIPSDSSLEHRCLSWFKIPYSRLGYPSTPRTGKSLNNHSRSLISN